jgi:esterase/lipase superfamily enzyme
MSSGAAPILENFGKEMTVSILGSVIDDIGRTVPKVTVSLLTGQAVVANARSDDNGEFGFHEQSVKVGFYAVRAAMPHYDPAEEELTLIWGMDKMSLDVVLRLTPHDKTIVKGDPEQRRSEENKPLGVLDEEDDPDEEYEDDGGGNGGGGRDPAFSIPPAHVDKAKYIHVRVLFATDRNRQAFNDPKKRFGNDWADKEQISFGACDVQLPYERKVGDVPRPSIFRLQFREDPNEHIVLKSCENLDATHFFREVSERSPSVMFFIHGYCVTFAEAIYRTAQIVDDIGFGGAPICYSWPSKGRFLGYTADEDSILWTRPHLYSVLRQTMKLQRVQTINVIAHSMGNRAVIECMDALVQEFSGTRKVNQVNQVVFAAPDVNAGIFRQYLDKVKGAAKRFTLYASSHDKPLKWSQWFRSWDRAGQGGPKLVVHPVLDSIDASAVPCGVLDHSYYGSTSTVLSDIHELFSYNAPPPRFATKGPKNDGSGNYWEIKT